MKKLTKSQQESKDWATKYLKEMFDQILSQGQKPVLKTVLKHVSRSGMRREITVLFAYNGEVINLNQAICALMQERCGNHDGIICDGCGMDMGFNLVYNLGASLYGRDCGHVHGTRNGEPDRDGGYALRHEWA